MEPILNTHPIENLKQQKEKSSHVHEQNEAKNQQITELQKSLEKVIKENEHLRQKIKDGNIDMEIRVSRLELALNTKRSNSPSGTSEVKIRSDSSGDTTTRTPRASSLLLTVMTAIASKMLKMS